MRDSENTESQTNQRKSQTSGKGSICPREKRFSRQLKARFPEASSGQLLSLAREYRKKTQIKEPESSSFQVYEKIHADVEADIIMGQCYGADWFGENPERKLKHATTAMCRELLELKYQNPNLEPLITEVIRHICAALVSDRPVIKFKPIILLGDPGIGKTYIGQQLAKVLGLDFWKIDGPNIQANFVLMGAARTWREARPGKLAEIALTSQYANPIVFFDEIDKIPKTDNHRPDAPFYALAEEHSAEKMVDEYFLTPLDMSHFNIIGTANDLSGMSDAMRSRFKIFHISKPTSKQARRIAVNVFKNLLAQKHITRFEPKLSEKVMDKLEDMTPREMTQALDTAIGIACKAHQFTRKPLRIEPEYIDQAQTVKTKRNPIGFAP